MNSHKTLSEICKELDVTRKVIRGYEKYGLVSDAGKDGYGRLIYDEESVKRIIRIRFYQKLGFTLKEIKELMEDKERDLKAALERRQKQLDREIRNLENRKAVLKLLFDECW